jgi:hypothetical protein
MWATLLRRNIGRYAKARLDGEKSSGTQAGRSISSTDRGTEHTVLYSQAARLYGQAGGRGPPMASNGGAGIGFPTRSPANGGAAAADVHKEPQTAT